MIYIYYLYMFHMSYMYFYLFLFFQPSLDPIWGTKYVYEPNFYFLEMAHTNLFSPIRKTTYEPLTCADIVPRCQALSW